jgi:large subunit ribosomal protein L21e
MLKRKRISEKRRIKLSQYFQELKEGDKVALVRNLSFKAAFPKRMHGKTGTIMGKQGKCYIVRLLNGKTYKNFTVHAIHLKKFKQ